MIILKKIDVDTKKTELRMNVDDITWPEVVDQFIHFLQGCGYVVQGIDVADHLMEQYGFQKEKPEVFINGSEVSLPKQKGKRHAKKR